MKLITKAIENALAKNPIYSQDGKGQSAKVICKFFFGSFTWYVLEGEKQEDGSYLFYGVIDNAGEREKGYFTQRELEGIKMWGYPCVERDMYFKPCLVSEI